MMCRPGYTSYSKPIKTTPNNAYVAFASIFDYKTTNEDLYNHLKNISPKIQSAVCSKQLINAGAWRCQDCEMDSSCIICAECYENSKDKHINHRVSYKSNINGCCDCGDADAWNPNGFCINHKGTIGSADNEIQSIISRAFDLQTSMQITLCINDIITPLIANLFDKNKSLFIKELDFFLTFIYNICKDNIAMLHIVSALLIQSYTNRTSHQCYQFTSSCINVIDSRGIHDCSCSLIQIIFENYQLLNNSFEHLLYLFLKNSQLKKYMGLSYLTSFVILTRSKKYSFKDFAIQIITEEVSQIFLNSNEFITLFSDSVYSEIKLAIYSRSFSELEDILLNLYHLILYLFKVKVFQSPNMTITLHKRMIDAIALLHNINSVKQVSEMQKEFPIEKVIHIELYLLEIFSLLVSLLDYSAHLTNITEIFTHFITILTNNNKKEYKELKPNEYSFHISLHRAFAIFINRIIFSYSIKTQVDLRTAVDEIITKSMINYETIVEDVFKFIGFMLSIQFKYWVYYGESFALYPILYHSYELYYLSDLILIRFICSSQKYSHLLSFDNIFKMTSVCGSYDDIKNIFRKNINEIGNVNMTWTQRNDSKHLMLGYKTMEYFIKILRANSAMVNLNEHMLKELYDKNKLVPREDINSFYSREKGNFMNMIISKLVHYVITHGNHCSYSEIKNGLSKAEIIFGSQIVSNIINEVLDKNISDKVSSVYYSVKSKYLSIIDLSFILTPEKASNAERYLLEFKSKEFNELQTVTAPMLDIERALQFSLESAFFNKTNREWFVLSVIAQLSNGNWSDVKRYYLSHFFKCLYLMMIISSENKTLHDDNTQFLMLNGNEIIALLDKPLVQCCEIEKKMCWNIRNAIASYLNIDLNLNNKTACSDESIKESANDKSNKKKDMAKKYKDMFKEKNQAFEETTGNIIAKDNSDGMAIELDLDKESNDNTNENNKNSLCVLCRMPINLIDHFNNPIGRFGMMVEDCLIHNSKIQTLRKEINAITNNGSSFNVSTFFDSDPYYKKKKQLRLFTCNHFVHYSCYKDFYANKTKETSVSFFPCPYCKLLSNTFIPNLNSNTTEKALIDLIKGLSFKDFMTLAKQSKLNSINYPIINQIDFNNTPCIKASIEFIEEILSHHTRQNVFLAVSANNKTLFNSHYNALLEILSNAVIYCDNSINSNQVVIVNSLLTSIKLCLVSGLIPYSFFIEKFIRIFNDVILFKDTNVNYPVKINSAWADYKFEEFIFLYMILFDPNEDNSDDNNNDNSSNICSNKTHITSLFGLFLPYIFAEIYLKCIYKENKCFIPIETTKNYFQMENCSLFFTGNEPKYCLISYLRKVDLYSRIFTNNTISNEEDQGNTTQCNANNVMDLDLISKYNQSLKALNISQYINDSAMSLLSINFPPFFPDNINNLNLLYQILLCFQTSQSLALLNNQPSNTIVITPSLMSVGLNYQYDFIDLPSNMIELIRKTNSIKCLFCNKTSSQSLLCLTCGSVVCYNNNCSNNMKKEKKKEWSGFIYHSEKCGGGYNAYLANVTGNIIFMEKKIYIRDIWLYFNHNGEKPGTGKILKDYKLSNAQVNKAKNMFIDFSYRKYSKLAYDKIVELEPEDFFI